MSEQFFNGVSWPARVKCLGKPMRVVMSFASGEDMERISAWADNEDWEGNYSLGPLNSTGHLTQDQRDVLEYVALLGGMYQTYDLKERFADSANRLEHVIRENPREDVLFALVMKLPDAPFGEAPAPFASGEILGFSAMRRTWKNSVKMEFLASSPFHMGAEMGMQGVGKALLTASVLLSASLFAPMFWAESSDTSIGYYMNPRWKFKTLEEIVYLDSAGIAGFVKGTTRRPPWYFPKT